MIKEIIRHTITGLVRNDPESKALYRDPIVGYASAQDPIFSALKSVAHPEHKIPADLLPDAKTVFAFFIPFAKDIIRDNKDGEIASRKWAETYSYTNQLISRICEELKKSLASQGISMSWMPPTYQFDKEKLMAYWSHKHIAFACGLGQFGLNHQLITDKGCGGRLGTGVLNVALEPNIRPAETHHCFYHTSGCGFCLGACPQKAITLPENDDETSSCRLDRAVCYLLCLKADEQYDDLGSVEVCGKCSTGPCAYLE